MAARIIDKYQELNLAGKLVAINVVVFLAVGLVTLCGKLFDFNTGWLNEWLALCSRPLRVLIHPWTIVTYMFTHFSVMHILFNMLWLWWFAQMVTMTMRERYVLGIYVGGGLAGALLYLLATNLIPVFYGYSYLTGASAGVLALMTVAAMRSPNFEVPLLFLGAVKLKWIAVVCIVLAFLGLGGGNSGGELAHLGGVAFGFAYAMSLKRGRDWLKPLLYPDRKPGEERFSKRQMRNAANAMRQRGDDMRRLNELLEKIQQSGYGSLSRKEKNELQQLSERLNHNSN